MTSKRVVLGVLFSLFWFQTGTNAAPDSVAGAGEAETPSVTSAAVPTWRRHYLLANNTVQLEPCSAIQQPRAWKAARPAAQGEWQLPGTAATQALIYAHQNPLDCSKSRFLVYQHPGHLGLGALLDYLADALSWAMAEDRVLLLDYPSPWTRGEPSRDNTHQHHSYCHGGVLALDECFFEPVSSCTLSDVYGPDVVSAWGINMDEAALHETRKKLHGDCIYFNSVTGQKEYSKIPSKAAAFLRSIATGLKVGGVMSEMFWWRAQGVAYICRLNPRTLQILRELKQRFFKDQLIPPGVVSVHVRRGNKARRHGGGEMGFLSDETFVRYATGLQSSNSDILKQAAFVSTEDPEALQFLRQNLTDWQVLYTTVPRQSQRQFGWVGTLGSSWTTLTERLRSTVRCKADKPYTDAHGTLAGLGSV